jgi:antitoxin component of RelBE/YafQ-DinJ toxin-antitoxin module
MEENKVLEAEAFSEEPAKEEKRVLSNDEIVALAKKQLQGINYFGVGIKGNLLRVILNDIASYEWLPVSLTVDDVEYEVMPIEELKKKDLENNGVKEDFFARKNAYLESKGKEKQEYTIEVKSKKKPAAMVVPKDDMLKELKKEINLINNPNNQ